MRRSVCAHIVVLPERRSKVRWKANEFFGRNGIAGGRLDAGLGGWQWPAVSGMLWAVIQAGLQAIHYTADVLCGWTEVSLVPMCPACGVLCGVCAVCCKCMADAMST